MERLSFTSLATGGTFALRVEPLVEASEGDQQGRRHDHRCGANPGFVYETDGKVLFRDTGTTWCETAPTT